MSNPLPVLMGLLFALSGMTAIYAGFEYRRTTLALGGFLTLLAGAGLVVIFAFMAVQ